MDVSGIGAKLREWRGERTVEEVCVDLRRELATEISPTTLRQFERGAVSDPSIRKLEALCRYYGRDIRELIVYGPPHAGTSAAR